MRRLIYFIVLVITIGFGVSFACLNAETVSINLYLGEYHLPLPILLLLTLSLGLGLGVLLMSFKLCQHKAENFRLRSRLSRAEAASEDVTWHHET
jgi:lipopolysaccharide assembly protein A